MLKGLGFVATEYPAYEQISVYEMNKLVRNTYLFQKRNANYLCQSEPKTLSNG